MKKLNYVFIIIGLILIGIPYLINAFSIFRLILLILGLILLIGGLILNSSHKIIKIILYLIFLVASTYTLDYFNYKIFNILPIYTWRITSSSTISTYNSFFYRIYDCNGKLIVDENYNLSYACKPDSLEEVSINKLLENPKDSYKEYKGKFIRVIGKINTIIGNSSFSLNAYEQGEEILNGYVDFDEEKKVTIEGLDIDPAAFHIYDHVEIVGQVSAYLEKGDTKEIVLKSAIVLENDIYDNYELLVNEINTYEKTKAEDHFYYVGLQGIFYRYSEDDIYELSYLLLDKKEHLDNLTKDAEVFQDDDKSIYKKEKYQIIVCQNEDVIFANKNFSNYQNIC